MRNLNKKKIALLTACVVSAVGHMAFAAEADNYDEYSGADYVVTATKTQLEKKEVPQSVEVITQEDIKNTAAYNVRDALRFATNIDVQEVGMTGNVVMVRGMESKHTLILVDGRRMAAENTGSTMNAYELSRINLADVERIEIIRGNGSALYGSDTMGGVINIITKKASQEHASVGAHTGTKEMGTNFYYSSGRQGKVSVKASGGIEDVRKEVSGYYNKTEGYDTSSSNMYGPRRFLNLGFDYAFDANRGLALDLNFMREQFTSNSSEGTDKGVYNYDNNRSDYALTYYGKDNKNDYNLRMYYNTLKKSNVTNENNAITDFDHTSYDTLVFEGKNSMKLNDKNTMTYGAEWTTTNMRGTRFGGGGDNKYSETFAGITKAGSEKDVDTYAAYLQDEWKITDKWLIIPAVRFDHHNAFGSHTSPKIGTTYSFSDNSRVKVNYGKSFRAPTVYELYSTMDKRMGMMNVQVLGNPDLKPEKATNFDIGFEAEQGKWSGKLGYYHNEIDNLIDSDMFYRGYVPGVGMVIKSKYYNVGEAEISGAEAEVGYNFNDSWNVKATYNYLDAKDKTTNARLNNRARQNGVVQLSYTDNAELPFTATLWSKWYVDYLYKVSQNVNTYTFNTFNFVADKQITKNLHVYAGVDNIFDKTLPYDENHSYTIDGRTWRVGAEMTF